MIIALELENIGPYTDKVVLDFRVNKRDKESLDTVYELPDGEIVTKVVGIIAGNAYGKTTILNSLNAVGGFIDNPMRRKYVNNYVSKISEEEVREYFLDFSRLSLIPINKTNDDAVGKIRVEMYIDNKSEYSGYYIYTLIYDNNYLENGVIEESLQYKKKYSSKIVKEIFKINNNMESEIGYKLAYKANILNDLTGKSKEVMEEKINYYETFFNRYTNESSTLGAENYIFDEEYIISKIDKNEELIKNFINLADKDIKEIEVDESDRTNKKLFFKYNNFSLRYNAISTATKKLCGIATNFSKASEHGGVFLIDELDNSLNKNIATFIINLYNTKIKNNTSQIIFTTNNAELLSNLRRDQIFIIEKNDSKNSIIKYLNFVDKDTKKKSRKDWSFVKAYNENVIKNFPTSESIEQLNIFIKENI